MDNKVEYPKVRGPAIYQIRVQGRLNTGWSDRLGGMRITVSGGGKTPDISTLEGRVEDQSSLSGILNTLHDLQLPVLYLECLDAE